MYDGWNPTDEKTGCCSPDKSVGWRIFGEEFESAIEDSNSLFKWRQKALSGAALLGTKSAQIWKTKIRTFQVIGLLFRRRESGGLVADRLGQ